MDTIDFSQFYNKTLYIEYYEESEIRYISGYVIISIIKHLKSIIDKIELKCALVEDFNYKNYLNSMKNIAQNELNIQLDTQNNLQAFINKSSNEHDNVNVKLVLNEDLKHIPVIELLVYNYTGITEDIDFGIELHKQMIDYLIDKEKLQELLQKKKDIVIKEDPEIVDERRQSVLKFEHPEGYINGTGDYQYCHDIINKIECQNKCGICVRIRFSRGELLSLVRSFAFRAKTKKHFEDLDRVEPYDYPNMKQSKKILHAEMCALYKVFKRRFNAPMAVAVKALE